MSENTIKYRQHGDYLLPELKAPDSPHIGVWGERRRRFLREHRRGIYSGMLLSGKLNAHLEEIDQQAEAVLFQLVKQLSAAEGVTEQLKAENQLLWVQRMNSVRERAAEIVNAELIFA